MQLTKGAIGNLINRYKAVLKKCHLMNTFGSLAVAGMLVMGGAAAAGAAQWQDMPDNPTITIDQPNQQNNYADVEKGQTVVVNGANTATGAQTSMAITGQEGKPGVNRGEIWVVSGEGGTGNGYAEGMGGVYNSQFSIVNEGSIFVDGDSASKAKAMSVNPNGSAENKGLIVIKNGGGIVDNSGSASKTMINSGTIAVEGEGGVGIFYRKEAITDGEVANRGTITVSNGGIGVQISNDTFNSSYNNKVFINSGTIIADADSVAIHTHYTDNATIRLEGASHVDGLIKLKGTNNKLVIDGVGANGQESLHVEGTLSGSISNGSNIAFTEDSQLGIDGAYSIDNTSTATLNNVTFIAGDNDASKALVVIDSDSVTLNGGLNTGAEADNTIDSMATTNGNATINGAVFKNNTFTADRNYPIIGAVAANLGDQQSLTITDSTFKGNTVKLTGTGSSGSAGGAAVSVVGKGEGSTLTIADSTFTGNHYQDTSSAANGAYGGAIGVQNASVILSNVEMSGNSADSGNQVQGGAYYQSKGSLTADTLKVSSNTVNTTSHVMGAGMALWGVGGSINNAEFSSNTATTAQSALGGGLYMRGSRWGGESDLQFSISNTSFTGNELASTADGAYGGGLYVKGDASNGTADGNGKISLELTGVTFDGNKVNGATESQGGALYILGADDPANATVAISNSTFTNNKAKGTYGRGGAIYNAGTLSVDSTHFENNTASAQGGAIYVHPKAKLDVTNGYFTGNSGTAGGAVALFGDNRATPEHSISNTEFEGNTATREGPTAGKGGAIAILKMDTPTENYTTKLDLNDVTFIDNTSNGTGGAIHSEHGTLTISDATFSGNSAEQKGGAIYNDAYSSITFNGTNTFTGNKAEGANGWGGAIYNSGELTVNGGEFTGNKAGKYGGAIAGDVDGKGSLTVKDATFTQNTSGAGGAIALWSHGTEEAAKHNISGWFDNNTADRKGGAIAFIMNHSGDQTATASISGEFLNNRAGESGGAIHSERAALTITDATFTGNSAEQQGGAIYNDANSSITFTGTNTFTNNKAKGTYGRGGAIYNAGTLSVNSTSFENNVASDQGGAIYVHPKAKLDVTKGYFKGNSGTAGGAVALFGDNGVSPKHSISNTEFEGNTATREGARAGKGGAIAILEMDTPNPAYTTALNLSNVTFLNNTSNGTGGAIHSESGTLTITDAVFSGNSAEQKGGNSAEQKGGAIYNDANSSITFNGTNTFTNNTAAGKPNDIYNAGTITVEGGTTTLNSGLVLAAGSTTTTVAGGALVVNGITEWKTQGVDEGQKLGKLELNSGTLTLQKNDVLNGYGKLADQITDKKAQLTLTSGSLYLITDQDYTLAELTKAQETLGIDSKETFLGFQGGKLVDDLHSDILTVDAETSGGVITGGSLVQIGESATTGVNTVLVENDLTIKAGNNSTVTITGNADVKANTVDVDIETSAGAASVVIKSDTGTGTGSLTVVGNGAGDKLVTSNGDALADITVENGGTFTMGIEGNSQAQGGQVGTVTVNGGTFNITGTAGQQSDYVVNELVLECGLMSVTNASNVHSNSTVFNGGMLFLDPSYQATATNVPVLAILTISEGSTLNLGFMDKATLRQAMLNAGLAPNADLTVADTQSVLALGQSITLQGTGQIVLDDEVTPVETAPGSGVYEAHLPSGKVTDTAYFGDDSLLVVDASKLGNEAAITAGSGGNAVIKDGAKLQIVNATKGDVTILNGFTGTSGITIGTGWGKDTSVANPDRMLSSTLKVDDPAGSVTVTSGVNRASDVLPGLDSDLDPVMASVWDNSLNDVDSADMGVRFLSRAANSGYIADAGKAAATIESAARIAFAGAVPQMTKMASDAGTNAVVNRLGFADPADGAQAMNAEGKIVDRNTTGFALWIAPLWQNQHGWGMEAGNMDYGFNGNLGGVSLGADYTFENAIRAGITFNIGGGYAETSGGDLSSTENRMNFWGLGAYAGWNYENFGVMADVSYTSTWNQLKQDLDSRLGMGNELEADVQATAISAGLRAEYKLETSVLDIIPHIGVRYMSLNTWGYDVEANGGNVLEGDGFHQDIWTFPVGVTLSKDISLDNGFTFKPSVDFSVIPAAGDIKAKQDVRFTGAPVGAELETQMMDYLTWQGGVGLELANDNMSIGVNYTLQAGQHTTGHGVFGSFRYEF